MRSILDGYLTDGCANCPDWADENDDRGYGCAAHYPIYWCPHFEHMMREEESKRRQELEQLCENRASE